GLAYPINTIQPKYLIAKFKARRAVLARGRYLIQSNDISIKVHGILIFVRGNFHGDVPAGLKAYIHIRSLFFLRLLIRVAWLTRRCSEVVTGPFPPILR